MQIQKIMVLNPISYKIRPWLWKLAGVNATGNFKVGYDVYFDAGSADYIHIEDDVWIASRSLILCHKRNLSEYRYGGKYTDQPQTPRPVTLKKRLLGWHGFYHYARSNSRRGGYCRSRFYCDKGCSSLFCSGVSSSSRN